MPLFVCLIDQWLLFPLHLFLQALSKSFFLFWVPQHFFINLYDVNTPSINIIANTFFPRRFWKSPSISIIECHPTMTMMTMFLLLWQLLPSKILRMSKWLTCLILGISWKCQVPLLSNFHWMLSDWISSKSSVLHYHDQYKVHLFHNFPKKKRWPFTLLQAKVALTTDCWFPIQPW